MSKIEVNAIEPQSGTTLTLGASGDTITIPAGATISNSGTAAGFGPTGAVSWDTTKKTTGFTAVSGVGYFCDTTSAAFTVTLPSTPSAGAVVGICDYANTFATNNLTVDRNGSKIGGFSTNSILSTNGLSITFVYVDATQGWIVTDSGNRSELPTAQYVAATGGTVLTCGNFKTHVFTGPGSFIVSCAGNSQGSNSVEYLVVAGGGGSGYNVAGGGGAGGYRQNYPSPATTGLPVTATTYSITVGAGGTGGTGAGAPAEDGGNGSNSIFSTITSTGGGGGARMNGLSDGAGKPGGSGGGAQAEGKPPRAGGTGNSPPVSPPQGNPGGPAAQNSGSGGGGASASGAIANNTDGGAGGIGSPIATAFFGPTSPSYGTSGPAPGRYFAGGGAGSSFGGPPAAGGSGGGGPSTFPGGTAGTVNTGGGAGGNFYTSGGGNGAAGGSGIVVIRYKFQ